MLTATLFTPFAHVTHGFTTREDGNLAFHVGDDPTAVDQRQKILSQRLNYSRDALVHMKQVHSNMVITTDESHHYHQPPTCDAIITNQPNRPLMVMVADCTPILLFDPDQKVIAAVHAGRAGAFHNIVEKTITQMHHDYGCHAQNILAVLGPSIHVCCYEVGKAINTEAQTKGFGYAMEERGGKHYLHVNAIILQQLQETGIQNAHIGHLQHCTACEHDRFFSYRADQQPTGRFAGVIMLR